MQSSSKGIKYMLFSTICFALINLLLKILIHIPITEIIFLNSLIALLLSFLTIIYKKVSLKVTNHILLIFRASSASIGMSLFFFTIASLPLATANVIQNTAPIFTAVWGMFIIKEFISLRRWLFLLLIAIGVTVTYLSNYKNITNNNYLIIIGLTSACLMGFANILDAKMKNTVDPLIIFTCSTLCTVVVTGVYTLYNFSPLNRYEVLLMLPLGMLTYLAQFLAIKAYQNGSTAKIAPISYLGIPYALIIDLLLGERFPYMTFVGISIVILGILLNIFNK